jgi:CTP:molybdopterin cytidylyltransferase MocA
MRTLLFADTTGIVLAAGAGTRARGPKAARRADDGSTWAARAAMVLLNGGCTRVVVVLGAAPEVELPDDPRVSAVIATDWADGMAASLRAGLAAATGDAALVSLVDLPDLPVAVVARMLAAGSLAQATYGGRPGHPVLIPAAHWAELAASLHGDRGARDYLVAHGALEVECGDLWHGRDRDGPPA